MARMWELPQLEEGPAEMSAIMRVRHSITDTDYEVLVFGVAELHIANSRWFTAKQWSSAALTGLARKILVKLARPQA